MKKPSINEIKIELEHQDRNKLTSFCIRLAKFKKENKELLSFLLFDADDIDNYIVNVKKEITVLITEINNSNIYYIKKSIRKILRHVNKNIRIAGYKQAEAEILIHFCNSIIEFSIPLDKNKPLQNIYESQLKKIDTALSDLHPDLEYDLRKLLKRSNSK